MRFYLRLLTLVLAAFVVAPSTVQAANKHHVKTGKQKHKVKRIKQRRVKKHR